MVACTPAAQQAIEENDNVEVTSDTSVAVDTNDNGVADVEVEAVSDTETEVTVDFEDVGTEVEAAVEGFCEPGTTYTYASEEGNVDSEIIGLTTYKGAEFCEAFSVTEINSPAGTITTETTYYFDNTYKEYWIVTTTSGDMMPEPQVNEIHLIDGKVA